MSTKLKVIHQCSHTLKGKSGNLNSGQSTLKLMFFHDIFHEKKQCCLVISVLSTECLGEESELWTKKTSQKGDKRWWAEGSRIENLSAESHKLLHYQPWEARKLLRAKPTWFLQKGSWKVRTEMAGQRCLYSWQNVGHPEQTTEIKPLSM